MTSNQRAFAIDCEMIDATDRFNTGHSFSKKFPIKVVIVDEGCRIVYDQFIRPNCRILCDNSWIHGINMEQVLQEGISYGQAQMEVDNILHGNIVVGHDLDQDLRAMGLNDVIPQELKRDTSSARIFARIREPPMNGWQKRSLEELAMEHLNEKIQQSFHDPIEDASTSMKLYNKFKNFSLTDWSKPAKYKP